MEGPSLAPLSSPGPLSSHLVPQVVPHMPRILEDKQNNNTRLNSPDFSPSDRKADIEQFEGKIVYNPDGSAYIIEDADYSDDEGIDLPRQEGSIVEKPGLTVDVPEFPLIDNAFYVARKKVPNYPSYVREQISLSDRPTVHSYRVYNYRHKNSEKDNGEFQGFTPENVPVKPILMCFICKLSFGHVKPFKNHCKDEHSLDFNKDELDMLNVENISALVQFVAKDKDPLLSFLEPVPKGHYNALPSDQVPYLRSPSKSPNEGGHIRVRNDLGVSQISPVSGGMSNGRSSTSPGASMSPSPSSFSQMMGNAYPLKGTTIGACPEHIQGRPTGVECPKCDMIINSNRLGGIGWNASNNACKTLKCPKCNWHYKYQETLEIHMKEKHPESETTCIYCITGQQHPRLARGETYTCGYKPYRCEVCNYSTTTKGNLSIHMQSDKHINNMQELQQTGQTGQTTPSPSPSSSSKYTTPTGTPKPQDLAASLEKEKPCWKCDVCNYETSIARNLRIHMTSEKHMNNVMNLQQMQNLGAALGGGAPGLPPMTMPNMPNMPNPSRDIQQMLAMSRMPGPPLSGSPMKEAAMADMAFNQALLMQMMGGGPPGGMPGPPPLNPFLPPINDNPDANPGEIDQAEPNPKFLYNCCVCKDYSCDNLQNLSDHLAVDRSKLRETEVSIFIGGTYICKLCSYKTNLKANFQLHCKTDKHLQKLCLVNHIMEGGPTNEWKLNFMNVSNSIQLRCNACDFYTDSIHKLQIHSANQGHEVSHAIFNHLRHEENRSEAEKLSYKCNLCKHSVSGKSLLLQHCRSVKHLQMEQLHMLQQRAEGKIEQTEIGDIFSVCTENPSAGNENHVDGDSEAENETMQRREEPAKEGEEQEEEEQREEEEGGQDVRCPLCQEMFGNSNLLETHAMQIHSINAEGLQRLAMLMQGSHWLSNIKDAKAPEEAKEGRAENHENNQEKDELSPKLREELSIRKEEFDARSPNQQLDKFMDPGRPYKCDVCRESFTQKSILLVHYNSVGHLRNLKRKMAEQAQNERNSEGNTSGDSEQLERSSHTDPESSRAELMSPAKSEKNGPGPHINGSQPVIGEIQNALQQAMIAARLQLLNPMMAQMAQMGGLPGMNPAALAAMGGMGNPFAPPGMGQLQQLQQLAMAQQMGNGGPPRMPDPAMILSQLAQLQPDPNQKMDQKMKFPPQSPVPSARPQLPPPIPMSMENPMFSNQDHKRARTKITEDQLKVLRSYFDISNSPSDDQINLMAQQTGLPAKVIKHWFRNTLFKERQKNKDSPYNFNNPPSTLINLEEYEKTGEHTVTTIEPPIKEESERLKIDETKKEEDPEPTDGTKVEPGLKRETSEVKSDPENAHCISMSSSSITSHNNTSVNFNTTNPVPNVTQSSLPTSLTLSSILSSQTMADSMARHLPNFPAPIPSAFGQSAEPNSFSKMLHTLAANTANHDSMREPSSPQGGQRTPGPQDMSGGSYGKRANRTRFSDYQVKVLQEFFDKNAYPKDDDLEYLSKLLGLTPRVIVVWFQNARQKARKAYENQPSEQSMVGGENDEEGRFTRTPSLSYQCKKCNLEFQRYYELIRHQKQHCYKEEDAKRSALAQKAAGAAAATLCSQGANLNMTAVSNHSEDSNSDSISYSERNITSPIFNQNVLSWKRKLSTEDSRDVVMEEPRNKLPKTTNLFPPLIPPTPPTSTAANDLEASMRKFYEDTMKRYMDELQGCPPPLQHHRDQPSDGQALDLRSSSADLDHESHRSENDGDSDSWDKNLSGEDDLSSEHNRGLGSEFDGDRKMMQNQDGNMYEDRDGQQGDTGNKRFRTHMSNVQVKMMKSIFENYKTPTMPECLELGNNIGLQKRVVQVWFQNARAKEKKARLYLQQVTGHEPDQPAVPRGCRWCSLQYPENFSVQEHIFQIQHLEKVRTAIEQGLYDPESPGVPLTQQADALQNQGAPIRNQSTPPRQGPDSATESSPSPSKGPLGPGLSMMAQMAAEGIHSPGGGDHMRGAQDSRSMLMQQFYGMGQGMASYPIGVTNTLHNI